MFYAVSQEAIATGDPELAQMVLRERDVQRYSNRATALPALLQRLTEVSQSVGQSVSQSVSLIHLFIHSFMYLLFH